MPSGLIRTLLSSIVVVAGVSAVLTPISLTARTHDQPAQDCVGMMTDLNGNRVPIPKDAKCEPLSQATRTVSPAESKGFDFGFSKPAQTASSRKDIPAIAKAASGAIVSIVMSDKDGKPIAQGSGFLVSKDGLIVTNFHVIAEGTSAVVKLPDGAFYVVDGVLALDKARDVAVIRAHGQNFRTLTLGNSDRVQVGEEVVAIGNPLSLESTVSNGIVSAIRTIEEEGGKFLQTTTPISPGSSGGPLFNMAGEVVGITTLKFKGGENLNFAIPVNDAKRLLLANSSRLTDLPNEPNNAAILSGISEELDLDETLNWIENSSRSEEENPGSSRDGQRYLTYIDSPIFMTGPGEGRKVIVTIYIGFGDRPLTSQFEYWFNLRDINPISVSSLETPRGFTVTAGTTNDEPKIEVYAVSIVGLTFGDRTKQQNVHSVTFELSPDYGPKFAKAFKRAVILAGGKPSP